MLVAHTVEQEPDMDTVMAVHSQNKQIAMITKRDCLLLGIPFASISPLLHERLWEHCPVCMLPLWGSVSIHCGNTAEQ